MKIPFFWFFVCLVAGLSACKEDTKPNLAEKTTTSMQRGYCDSVCSACSSCSCCQKANTGILDDADESL